MTATRGIRNNNPGNIVKSGIDWVGKVDGTDERFETFDTAQHGLEALCKLLLSYQMRHGLNTVRGIINRWAPPVENDTGGYVSAVARQIGRQPDQELDLREPETLSAFATAIVQHENGQQPYLPAAIYDAARTALGLAQETQPAAPIEDRGTPYQPEPERKPMAPLLLGPIIDMIPALIGAFSKGPQGEKNSQTAQLVVDTFTKSVPGAVNAQDAIEKVSASPTLKAAAVQAVLADPSVAALIEVTGGVPEARKANLALVQSADKWWKLILNPVFLVTLFTLPLVYLFVWRLIQFLDKVSPDVISQTMGTVIGLVLGSIMGFWMGQTWQQTGQTRRATDIHPGGPTP